MIDLRGLLGLPISFNEKENELIFDPPLDQNKIKVKSRKLESMKNIWMDQPTYEGGDIYHMYFDVCLPEHRSLLIKNELSFCLILIPPLLVGKEFIKTVGHYHPPSPSTAESYPEIYIPLYGTAHFILQKSTPPYEEVTDVVLVEAESGHPFIIPPNYGHISINPFEKTLIFAAMLATNFKPNYQPFQKRKGAAYYEILEDETRELIPNKNYQDLPPLRKVRLKHQFPFPSFLEKPFYERFIENLEQFEFLKDPGKYQEKWLL